MKNKILFTLLFVLTSTLLSAQNITLSLENPQISNDGVNDYYDVDVFLVSDIDYVQGVGLFYMDYNTAAFGTSVVDVGDPDRFQLQRPAGSILGSQSFSVDNYNQFGTANNTDAIVAVSWRQFWSSGTIGTNVSTTPTLLCHIRMKFTDVNELPGLCFNVAGPSFDDEFFTACGPFDPAPAGADCTGVNAGTQIFDYTPDCSGTVISCPDMVTYTAGGWMPSAPTSSSSVTLMADYNTTTNGGSFEACELNIPLGVSLTIEAGDFINVQNDINVDGSLFVRHQGSVVQVNSDGVVTNNGVINVDMTTPTLGQKDFMVMGSPMTGESREGALVTANVVRRHLTDQFEPHPAVPGGTENFADINTNTTLDWILHTGVLNPAEGYFMRPQDNSAADATYQFVFGAGTLNTGDVVYNATLGFDGTQNGSPNVLSNPYPSAILSTSFMAANGIGELFFWEHNTQPMAGLPGQQQMNFSMQDISMINAAGVGNAAASGGAAPTNFMASMQGFAFKAASAGPVTFTNAMRSTTGNNTLRNADLEQRDIVRLQVRSNQYDLGSTTTVAFLEEGSSNLDQGLDNKRLSTIVSLYTHLEDLSNEFGIQTREPFEDGIKIPVGFATQLDTETTYRISLSDLFGVNLTDSTPYLIDNYKNTITNLLEGDYEFSSVKGTFNGRFTLQFKDGNVLDTSELTARDINMYPNPTNGIINIISPKTPITGVTVYDMQGRIVEDIQEDLQGNFELDLSRVDSAVYFVTVQTEQGNITKRVIKQ